jgi:hypothetical protein
MEELLASALLRAIEGYYRQQYGYLSISLDEFERHGKEAASIAFTLTQGPQLINQLHTQATFQHGEWHVRLHPIRESAPNLLAGRGQSD